MFYMDVYDTNFEKVGIIDVFKSCIWSERYNEAGQFELYIEPSSSIFKKLKEDYYLDLIKDDNIDEREKSLMIIEDFKLTTNNESGNSVSIVGRNLSSLLDRRVIWEPTIYAGPIEEGIRLLLKDNFINPKNELRKIDSFEFVPSNDERIQKIGIELNVVGDSLYETINTLCQTNGLGYKITYSFDTKKMYFKLYMGQDRGLDNPDGNLVIEFSAKNDNLLASNYTKTNSSYKNTILIGGDGEEDKRYFSVLNNYNSGINRKETFVESNLVFGNKEDRLPVSEYERQLKDEGKNKLKEVENLFAFDGETLGYTEHDIFKINKDFFLGDIVYIVNEYDISGNSRITEITESYDENGYSFIPTYEYFKNEPAYIQGTIYIDSENKTFTIKDITKAVRIMWGDGKIDKNITGDITHTYDGKDATYKKTEDTVIVEGKTYYTRSGTEGAYKYTKVDFPVASELQNYYEIDTPSDYEGLYDFKIFLEDGHDIDICPKFTDSTVLYKIDIPNGLLELQEKTFYNCTLLSSVMLPPSLKTIHGEQMFYNCTNLYLIVLPNSITNASANTFQNCTNLVSANFPYNCEIAPTNYFNNCPKLKSMNFPGNTFSNVGVKTIQQNVLNSCPKCKDITFGSMVTNINSGFLSGPSEEIRMKCLNYIPPTLSGNFSISISEIEVPNSPKFDDSVLNAYKAKQYWSTYSNKIKEKDGELPKEDINNSEYSYAENSSKSRDIKEKKNGRIPDIDRQISEQNEED